MNTIKRKQWNRLCSPREIAEDAGVHPKTAIKWIKDGLLGERYPLPCGRGGRTEYRVLTQNYFRFLESRKVTERQAQ